MRFLGKGGVGGVLDGFNTHAFFCLKLVKRSCDKEKNGLFWNAARGAAAWTAYVRYNSNCHKVPMAQQYWIRNDQYKDKPSLSSVIENHTGLLGNLENCPENLKLVDPDKYFLCPEDVLENIRLDDMKGYIKPLDLLITYPVQKGGKSLESYIDERTEFSERELTDCCYQILSVIFDLYKHETAHRDIKPANILVEENDDGRKIFKLTDFDSFTSPEYKNCLATRAFEPVDCLLEELESKHSSQNFFTLLDCFALAQTLSCMAAKKNIPPVRPPEKIPKILRALHMIGTFSPEEIKPLLTRLEKEYGLQKPELVYIPTNFHEEYRFDLSVFSHSAQWQYGTFHEQIRFSEKFDPLLKIKGHYWDKEFCRISDIILMPLSTDSDSTFFHAPDDSAAHQRTVDFRNYKPKSLVTYSPTKEEKETLLQYGKRLNSFFQEHGKARYISPEHVIWVDGEIRILYVGKEVEPYDAEKCFRLFCGEEKVFDSKYWQNVLKKAFLTKGRGFEPFFDFPEFKEYVFSQTKEEKFSPDETIFLWDIFPELEIHLTKKIAVEIYRKSSSKKQDELRTLPEFSSKIQDFIDNDPEERFKIFFRNKKFDEKTFLKTFPENVRQLLTGEAWGKIIAVNSELLKFVPNEIFSILDLKTWVNFLKADPELIKKCNKVSSFSSAQWCSILLNQPLLKKYLPKNIVFSENEQKRLAKEGAVPDKGR